MMFRLKDDMGQSLKCDDGFHNKMGQEGRPLAAACQDKSSRQNRDDDGLQGLEQGGQGGKTGSIPGLLCSLPRVGKAPSQVRV